MLTNENGCDSSFASIQARSCSQARCLCRYGVAERSLVRVRMASIRTASIRRLSPSSGSASRNSIPVPRPRATSAPVPAYNIWPLGCLQQSPASGICGETRGEGGTQGPGISVRLHGVASQQKIPRQARDDRCMKDRAAAISAARFGIGISSRCRAGWRSARDRRSNGGRVCR
jgi:hypothetical protein